MEQIAKHYSLIFLDAVLLFIPWLDDADQVLKTLSLIGGLILLVYTIRKLRIEHAVKKLEEKKLIEELKNRNE